MKRLVSIFSIVFLFSVMATSQSGRPVLVDKNMAKDIARLKPVSAPVAAASDQLGDCIADGWEACGVVCGDSCTLAELFACQDEITAACNKKYGTLQ